MKCEDESIETKACQASVSKPPPLVNFFVLCGVKCHYNYYLQTICALVFFVLHCVLKCNLARTKKKHSHQSMSLQLLLMLCTHVYETFFIHHGI